MDSSLSLPQSSQQGPSLLGQSVRPDASRRPSHTSRMPSSHSRQEARWWSEQYNQEARDENARRINAATDMHDAIKKADVEKLKELLQNNADLDPRDGKGRTALHIAAKFGRNEHLELLLERKDVDIDALDIQKETPLHLAAMYNHRECVDKLLQGGANTELADERGHLPRYYASSPQVARLFENPPKISKRGRKTTGNTETKSPPDMLYLSTAASAPQGMQKTLYQAFRGSFWEPDSDIKWSSASIWDLVYGESEISISRRAAGSKWIHLSATSESWSKDLARNICAARGYTSERSRAMRDFIGRVFKSVDAEGPVRKHHFMRERASERKLADDEMYAVVLPVIDVDKRDYVQTARNYRSTILNRAAETELLLRSFDTAAADPVLGMHFTRMLQLSSFLDQALPRSLDQSYHEYLDDAKIELLDSDQVMTRYISRLKAKSAEHVRKPSEKRFSIFGMTSKDSLVGPMIPAPMPGRFEHHNPESHQREQYPGGQTPPSASTDGISESQSQDQEMHFVDNQQPEPDDLITVPNFWLFKLDADTVVTLYPERWDKTNEARLHDYILNSVSNNRDIQDSPETFSTNALVEAILKSCMLFEAKAFAKCITPGAPENSHDVEVAFSKAYSNSIAEIYTEATERFDALKNGLGSLSKDPNAFYRDVKEETKILIRVDDNIGEIRMIKRILLNQATTFDIFRRAMRGDNGHLDATGSPEGASSFHPANVETFSHLETEAERVRAMAVTLLDLRQREASIEDALSMGEQSTMLFIFTTVTVLFAPLSFVCGLLAMNIDGLPDIWSTTPLAGVFGLATLGTMGLCTLMWTLYKIYQAIETAQRSKGRQPRHPPPAISVTTTNLDVPTRSLWRVPWRPRSGFRFRQSRSRQYNEATHEMSRSKMGSSARDKSSGYHAENWSSNGITEPGCSPVYRRSSAVHVSEGCGTGNDVEKAMMSV